MVLKNNLELFQKKGGGVVQLKIIASGVCQQKEKHPGVAKLRLVSIIHFGYGVHMALSLLFNVYTL